MSPNDLISLFFVTAFVGASGVRLVLKWGDAKRWSTPDGQAQLRAAGTSPMVATLVAHGETIPAIKAYRAEHQVTLREAKAVIDHLTGQPDTRQR